MANSIQDNIRSMLSQYKFKIDLGDSKENLTCIICKNLLTDAYQTYCGCQYCNVCIVEYLSNGKMYCIGGKEECSDEYLQLEENVLRNAMLNRKILKTKVLCPHASCTYTATLGQMEDHLRICTKQAIECPYFSIGCDSDKAMKDQILTHLHNEELSHTQLLLDLIQNLKNELGALKNRFEEKENKIFALENELRSKEIAVADMRERIESLSTIVDQINIRTNMTGEMFFEINGFSDACKSNHVLRVSDCFYSHKNGYKIRLVVNPGGVGSGSGTHLSVFIQICKGEYDSSLEWPCRYRFNLAIVNQRRSGVTCNTKTLSYQSCPNKDYNKPINFDNDAHGLMKFLLFSDLLSTEGLVVDDRLIIKCTVTAHSG